MIGALPGRALEAAGRAIGQRAAGGQGVLDGLERRADVVAEPLEPGAGMVLAGFERRGVGEGAGHGGNLIHWARPFVCRIASPSAIAATIATLIERNPGRIGMSSRASAA